MEKSSRRGFMGKLFGFTAAVGAGGSLIAMKQSWDPLPSVKAAGFTTVDTASFVENALVVEKWRGKPIFILKKTADMVSKQSAEQTSRDVIVDGAHYMIAIGLCTHLGCIPAYADKLEKFQCACHGGEFDTSGIDIKSPPPSPLVIPPFKVSGKTLMLGEEGPEYLKMKEAGILA